MKIVVAGNYGAKSIGDEMILEGIFEMINKLYPNSEITVLSENPSETKLKYSVNSEKKIPVGFWNFFTTIFDFKNKTNKAIKECDLFILGGGGLFDSISFKGHIQWTIQAMIAYFYGKPVIMYGQSISPLKGKISKWLVKKAFKHASIITVRDKESKQQLRNLNIRQPIHLIPDMAFRRKFGFSEEISRHNEILINLRSLPGLKKYFYENMADFINWLINKENWYVQFIDFQKGKNGDSNLHKKIIEKIEDKSKISYCDNAQDYKEIIQRYSSARVVLGMRLHSLISAIKSATPFIAINYDPKVKAFLKSNSLEDHLLELGEIGLAKLQHHFKEILKNENDLVKKLKTYNALTQKRHLEVEDILKNVTSKRLHRNV